MTIKNKNLNSEVINVINDLLEQQMNASGAFKLVRVLKALEPLIEAKMGAEKRIYDKWVRKDEDGNFSTPVDEEGNPIPGAVEIINMEEFDQELNELNGIENDIPYDQMEFSELGLETIRPKDILTLDFLFT